MAFVYVIAESPAGPVKVGYSVHPIDQRMGGWQEGNPRQLIWRQWEVRFPRYGVRAFKVIFGRQGKPRGWYDIAWSTALELMEAQVQWEKGEISQIQRWDHRARAADLYFRDELPRRAQRFRSEQRTSSP